MAIDTFSQGLSTVFGLLGGVLTTHVAGEQDLVTELGWIFSYFHLIEVVSRVIASWNVLLFFLSSRKGKPSVSRRRFTASQTLSHIRRTIAAAAELSAPPERGMK